ncbi:MFS transporter [Pseudonocardia kunmingensis]|uniref:MFS transporter n=1 Tax=Pseudonocardia kunmingensis TaxID=630975 RepID=UPI001FE77DE6|nr:MFS transporter [Pseudonocardia kunmingensis]
MPTSGPPPPAAPEAAAAVRPERLGFARLVRTRGYRRLLAVRFTTQWADGMFQAALGGAVLFNPERQADPLAVAAGLAVLLLPYSVIGPFAGALLDRWDRRRVLLGANLVRAALVVVVAAVVVAGGTGPALYLPALAVAGVSRFVLAGLSVALPHVVPRRHLVEANTFAVTAGAATAALGGASAIGLRELIGTGDAGSGAVTLTAIVGSLVAAALAAGFPRGRLGPDRTDGRPSTVGSVLHGFADGARATIATPSVAASFVALATHRLAFGISTLLSLLLFRYAFADAGPLLTGMAGLGQAVVLAAAGLGIAALLTPWMVRRWGRPRTVRVALLVATATQLTTAVLLSLPAVLAAAFVLGLTGQIVKLCTDAAVQGEVGDEVLGRVFALYDIVFNVGYVVAVAAAALLSPPDGRAPLLLAGAALLYVLGLVAHDLQLRRKRESTPGT